MLVIAKVTQGHRFKIERYYCASCGIELPTTGFYCSHPNTDCWNAEKTTDIAAYQVCRPYTDEDVIR